MLAEVRTRRRRFQKKIFLAMRASMRPGGKMGHQDEVLSGAVQNDQQQRESVAQNGAFSRFMTRVRSVRHATARPAFGIDSVTLVAGFEQGVSSWITHHNFRDVRFVDRPCVPTSELLSFAAPRAHCLVGF